VSVAAKWSLRNEVAKRIGAIGKTAGQFMSERLTEMKLLRMAAD